MREASDVPDFGFAFPELGATRNHPTARKNSTLLASARTDSYDLRLFCFGTGRSTSNRRSVTGRCGHAWILTECHVREIATISGKHCDKGDTRSPTSAFGSVIVSTNGPMSLRDTHDSS
jgi:hypothetical protein